MEDALMLIMYFIIALLSGILTTKIRQYEKQIQAREEKINTIKLYNTLLNSVSHELRTPMTTIIGISENLMYNNDNLKSEERLMLNKEVFIAGNRLNRLVDNLLDMSRLESGFLKLRYDWCDVHDLINSLTKKLEKELSAHSLRVDIPEDIPLIKIDRVLFEQALFNILHNATVYTPAGSNIDLQVTILNEQLKIVIADNGPGFATGDAEQLFEKFYRGKEKKTGGLGLGLSIAKGFILAHNGSISIKNRSTGGAEIQILIPVEKTQMDIYHE
jgi:two-component system sensor histidine kinase KdpD